jgi:uncharacterized protein (TIGR00290 family)
MRFAMSYSSGKDGALALWRMIEAGHEPICLLVTFNDEAGRSWFHGINAELLAAASESMGIPLIECHTSGKDYHLGLEKGLAQAAELGATACVFGDIDIDEHLEWNTERCTNTGLECIVPLWKQDREALVSEVLDAGFKAIIKCVESKWLSDDFLGKTLTPDLVEQIRETGSDVCGENGEYHTFVYDGPTFRKPLAIKLGDIIDLGAHSAIDVSLA